MAIVKVKPNDQIVADGVNGQTIYISISDDTEKGFIDISVGRDLEPKDAPNAKVRIYISEDDDPNTKFKLTGKGPNSKQGSCVYIEGTNIRLIGSDGKDAVNQAVLGNELYEWLTQLINSLIAHSHPMESTSVNQQSTWINLKNKLQKILSKNIGIN